MINNTNFNFLNKTNSIRHQIVSDIIDAYKK